jgi:formamidopyrimidine-DNA glycosylase
MPELPDLQVFSRNLNKRLAGKTVKKISVPVTKNLKISVTTLKSAIEKQRLEEVYREGKELRFKFSNGTILGVHLMLRGRFYFFETTNDKKSTVCEILFTDDEGLVLADPFKAATVTLNPVESEVPDALSKQLSFAYLKKRMQGSRAQIKSFLGDQKNIRGIGSAYSDDMLWEARISPFSVSNKIPVDKIRALLKAIRKVFKDGEKSILKEFPDTISTETRDYLKVHNPRRTHSPTGAEIRVKDHGLTKTYYTDEQVLYE